MGNDKEQIVELAVRYCTALDTRDWPLLERCFTDDAVVRYPGFDELKGIAAVVEFLREILRPLDATQHLVSNFTVELAGDTATLVSYLHAQHVRGAASGGSLYVVAGTYYDDLVRGEEGWRIARRELTTTWTDGNPEVLG
jgi:ketosteroid isomerase-like protein